MTGTRDVGTPSDVAALFADVAGIGPFFAVGVGPPPGEGWVPVAALGDPHGPIAERIADVEQALGAAGRISASIAFQGVAAQVVAPLFAAVAVHGVLPAAEVAPALHWRPGGDGPWLWWAGGDRVVVCPDPALSGTLLTTLLTPVVAAVRARVAVAERVLWGNVASSVASARRLVAAARPEAASRAAGVGRQLLTAAPLAATATLREPEPPDLGWTFHRRSCCLYYRVPGGGVCGDCVLRTGAAPGTGARIRYA